MTYPRLRTSTRLRRFVKSVRAARAPLFAAQNAVAATESVIRPKRRIQPDAGDHHELAAMVRVKDEARFLPEWLAYHVVLGVEHAYVYDNNSSDDITSVMAPFVEAGYATIIPWPTTPISPSAQNDFLERFGPRCRWVAFLDADEFLVEHSPGALRAALDAQARRPAVAVSSRYCGSAGHETIPPGLVVDRFDRAAARLNDHVKVIARPAEIHRYRNPHNFYYRFGRLARTPDGRRVFGTFVRADADADLVLHHYLYRSREDYERKSRSTYSTASGGAHRSRRMELADEKFRHNNDAQISVPETAKRETARMLAALGFRPELHRRDGTPSGPSSEPELDTI
jgi:hypothetical protein